MKPRIFLLSFLWCACVFPPIYAQDSLNVTTVALLPYWDEAFDVRVYGNYAFVVCAEAGMRIVDKSDPLNLSEIGFYDTPSEARDVVVNGEYAYIASQSCCCIVNIQNLEAPYLVSQFDVPASGMAWSIDYYDNHIFVGWTSAGIYVFDVSDPPNPIEVENVYLGDNILVDDVTVYEERLYITWGDGWGNYGIKIYDISNPNNLQLLGSHELVDASNGAIEISVSGDYAYVAVHSSSLRILDVSNPSSIQQVGIYSFWFNDISHGVKIQGNHAYMSIAGSNIPGLWIINVSNPYSPQSEGYCYAHWSLGVDVADNHAFLAAKEAGIHSIDITDPLNPFDLGSYGEEYYLKCIDIDSNYAYVGNGYYHFNVYDISNPYDPMEVYKFPSSNWAGVISDIVVQDNYAIEATWYDGLYVFDIMNPLDPQEIGYCEIGEITNDIVVTSNYCYIANDASGLKIVDISDPTNPYLVSQLNTDGNIKGLDIAENYAYITDSGQDWDFRIVDISDPLNPRLLGGCDTPYYPEAIAVRGDYAFIGEWGDSVFSVLNIENTHSPFLVTSLGPVGYAIDVFLSNNYAYVSCTDDGLYIYDITDPNEPFIAGYYDTWGESWSMSVSANLIYLADHHYFSIYNNELILNTENNQKNCVHPSSFTLHPSFPNPFNPATTLNFQLPHATSVELNVYDIIGNLVKTLSSGWHPPGSHQVTFNASDLSSGIYFVHFVASDFQQTQKLVLMK
jgi:hypothetical protein